MQQTQAPNVVVTVGADNQPVCTPDTVRARGRNAVLMFELRAAGYVFPASGAVVVADPGTQFPEPSRTVGPRDTRALLLDINSDKRTYKYTVAVQHVATGTIVRLDPAIQNGD